MAENPWRRILRIQQGLGTLPDPAQPLPDSPFLLGFVIGLSIGAALGLFAAGVLL